MTHLFRCLLTEAREAPSLKSHRYSVSRDSRIALLRSSVFVAVLACSLLEAQARVIFFFFKLKIVITCNKLTQFGLSVYITNDINF